MGMDVYGNKDGAYFRRNIWGWRPLAELVCRLEPELTAGCTHWFCNSGDGLKARASRELAKSLQAQIASGRVGRLVAARDKALAALVDEQCKWCAGTGVRTDATGIADGLPTRVIGPDTGAKPDHPRFGETGWCNCCDGRGSNRPSATNYPLTVKDVREFAEFLADCGGFAIG
jgi:hypothetical protein